MTAAEYARHADEALGLRRNTARVYDIFGATPAEPAEPSTAMVPAGKSSMSDFLRGIAVDRPRDVPDGVGTLVGAVAGAYLFRETHPYLGIIGGGSIGRNLPALFDPYNRRLAARNLVTTGGGVGGSLLWKEHPVLGFILGTLAGGMASYYTGLR